MSSIKLLRTTPTKLQWYKLVGVSKSPKNFDFLAVKMATKIPGRSFKSSFLPKESRLFPRYTKVISASRFPRYCPPLILLVHGSDAFLMVVMTPILWNPLQVTEICDFKWGYYELTVHEENMVLISVSKLLIFVILTTVLLNWDYVLFPYLFMEYQDSSFCSNFWHIYLV